MRPTTGEPAPRHDPRAFEAPAPPQRPLAARDLVVEDLSVEAAGHHAGAWARLDTRALEPNPFMDPDFCLPAARHLAAGAALRFLFVWSPGPEAGRRLLAVCPLERAAVPGWPIACVWFHDLATLGAPLIDREAAAPALLALLEWLRLTGGARAALRITALDHDGPTARLLAEVSGLDGRPLRFIDRRRRAVLRRDGLAPAGLAGLSSRRAKEAKRQRRRLAEQGLLRYTSASDPDGVTAELGRFLALEARGWKGRAGTALASSLASSAFVADMADRMAARGGCRIDALRLDGEPIAMGIVLRSHDRDFFWKTAFAEDRGPHSPGVQFVLDLTRMQASLLGTAMTDSCAVPDHPMIDRLWPDRLVVADVLIGLHPGRDLGFNMAFAMERARRCARAGLKRLVSRLRREP